MVDTCLTLNEHPVKPGTEPTPYNPDRPGEFVGMEDVMKNWRGLPTILSKLGQNRKRHEYKVSFSEASGRRVT